MRKTAFAALAAALVALAGCSESEPQGTIESTSHAQTAAGTATVVYQPFTGQNPSSGLPPAIGNNTQCAQGQLPGQAPVDRCKGPYTDVRASFSGLPATGSLSYTLRLTGVNQEVGTSAAGGNVSFARNFTTDLTNQVTGLELRLGDFLYMTAPATGAAFVHAPHTITVQGSFLGSNLAVNILGLAPSNTTYTGYLYLPGATDPVESFPVANGDNAYATQRPGNEYGEFHIHVGDSKLNLYKGTFKVQEE